MEISMENISIQIKPSFYEAISYQRTYYEKRTDSRPRQAQPEITDINFWEEIVIK